MLWGCLVCVFKQPFSVFKQYFTHFNALFHLHVFPQIFSNNNFQFLITCIKRAVMLTIFSKQILDERLLLVDKKIISMITLD